MRWLWVQWFRFKNYVFGAELSLLPILDRADYFALFFFCCA